MRTALVVGAGIGGLAAAIALQRAGWRVRVFERAAHARELGFALNLAPNAMAALAELGVADTLRAQGHVTRIAEIRRADGRLLRRVDVAASRPAASTPSLMALRPVLHGALLAAIGGDALEVNSEAAGFETASDRVVLRLKDGREASGDVLISADGVGSTIRRALHPAEPPPRATGYCAVRGVAHDAVLLLDGASAVGYLGDGVEAATVRASQNAVYWYVSLLAADLPAGTREPRSIVERCGAGLHRRFHEIVRATKADALRFDELFDRRPVARWGAGRVTLLGDAAHPMLPHAGQGAAQAIEDAIALGIVLGGSDDIEPALRAYERVRATRTAGIVRLARRIARVTTTHNRLVIALRNATMRGVPASLLVKTFFLEARQDPHEPLRSRRAMR